MIDEIILLVEIVLLSLILYYMFRIKLILEEYLDNQIINSIKDDVDQKKDAEPSGDSNYLLKNGLYSYKAYKAQPEEK